MKFLATIGRAALGLMAAIGRITMFAFQTLVHMVRGPFYLRELAIAFLNIG
jgi:phospholipid/cholesterol/gamma-HCH transport system permease protein